MGINLFRGIVFMSVGALIVDIGMTALNLTDNSVVFFACAAGAFGFIIGLFAKKWW